MKNKILSLILSATLIFSVSGCGKNSDDVGLNPFSSNETTEDTTEGPDKNISDFGEGDIIIINDYSNYAEGYQQSGWFATGGGKVYNYDFSRNYEAEYIHDGVTYSFTDMLKIIRTYAEPTATCDAGMMEKIYKEGIQIDPNAEYITENVACDAGQHSIIFYDNEKNELIRIAETGDNDVMPTDKHAKNVFDYNNMLAFSSTDKEAAELFTPDNYYFGYSNCGYLDGAEGNYVLFNEGELRAFKELTGVDIVSLFPSNFDPTETEYEKYIYFVNVTNESNMGYYIHYDALLKQGDNFRFIPAQDYSEPEPEEAVPEALDGFVNVCALKTYDKSPESHDYLDWSGQPLKRLEASENVEPASNEFVFPKEAAGEYYFGSGAGAWETDLTINSDGTFEAIYHDSNLGESGDDYDATIYIGSCSGKFTIKSKQNEYVYEMSVEITEQSPDSGEYIETEGYDDTTYNVKYINSSVYGIEGGKTFLLILEGAPTDTLPEDYIGWVSAPHVWGNYIPDTLPFNGVYNVEEGCGFGQ